MKVTSGKLTAALAATAITSILTFEVVQSGDRERELPPMLTAMAQSSAQGVSETNSATSDDLSVALLDEVKDDAPLVPKTDTTHDIGPTTKVAPAKSLAAEIESLCPQCPRCLQPCTSSPHTRLQCTDPMVAELQSTPNVWEVWCMSGKTEIRLPGKFPPPAPEGSTAKLAMRTDTEHDIGQTMAIAKSSEAALICSPEPLSDPTKDQCGFYRVVAGDRYRTRVVHGPAYDYLTEADLPLATPGDWMLAAHHLIFDVRLLPCDHPNVVRGAKIWTNVFCYSETGDLKRLNPGDERMDPLSLLSVHAHVESFPIDMRPRERAR